MNKIMKKLKIALLLTFVVCLFSNNVYLMESSCSSGDEESGKIEVMEIFKKKGKKYPFRKQKVEKTGECGFGWGAARVKQIIYSLLNNENKKDKDLFERYRKVLEENDEEMGIHFNKVIIAAARANNLNDLERLINRFGGSVEATTHRTLRTPLHWFAVAGDFEGMKAFIKRFGPMVEAKDINGKTALFKCLSGEVDEYCKEFFYLVDEYNANLWATDKKGNTLFHEAVQNGSDIWIKRLIGTFRSKLRCKVGYADFLLKYCKLLFLKNKEGKDALQLAMDFVRKDLNDLKEQDVMALDFSYLEFVVEEYNEEMETLLDDENINKRFRVAKLLAKEMWYLKDSVDSLRKKIFEIRNEMHLAQIGVVFKELKFIQNKKDEYESNFRDYPYMI